MGGMSVWFQAAQSVLMLALINLSHAAGHLIVARFFGVAVNRLSLGLGPTLWSRTAGATTYRLALFPVGLFVRLRAPWSKEDAGVWPPTSGEDLRSKSPLVRLAVFVAAPGGVLALGFIAAFLMAGIEHKVPSTQPVVWQVIPNSPAQQAGIRENDTILKVGGQSIRVWGDIRHAVWGLPDKPVQLDVKRGEELLQLELQPKVIDGSQTRMIGILGRSELEHRGFAQQVGFAASVLVDLAVLPFEVVGQRGQPSSVAAPVAFNPTSSWVEDASERRLVMAGAITYAMVRYFWLCLLLPYLDGGRLFFLGLEVVARKAPHPKYEQWMNRLGLGVWLVLTPFIVASYVIRLGR